jgi:hypothetical protein
MILRAWGGTKVPPFQNKDAGRGAQDDAEKLPQWGERNYMKHCRCLTLPHGIGGNNLCDDHEAEEQLNNVLPERSLL